MSMRNGNWVGVMAFLVFVELMVLLLKTADLKPRWTEDTSYRQIHPNIVAVPDTVTGATCYVWTNGTVFFSCVK